MVTFPSSQFGTAASLSRTNDSSTAGTAYNTSGATGQYTGGFFGPAAAEAAGVFYLSGGTITSTSVLGSFGAAKTSTPSDRRVKDDIVVEGTLPNGLKLYSWRYLGGSCRFTGVMAQDLLADARFAGAVETGADGLMRVDYAAIGFIPADLDAMRADGERAVAEFRHTFH